MDNVNLESIRVVINMGSIVIYYFLFGSQQQSKEFLISKMVIYIILNIGVAIWSSLKNVNDETINGKKGQQQTINDLKPISLVGTVVIWYISMFGFGNNLDTLINPSVDSNIMGMCITGSLTIFGFIWMVSAWYILLINIKKSDKTPEEKVRFYLDDNRTWNGGITGFVICMAGAFMFMVTLPTKPATKEFEFHPVELSVALIVVIGTVYLSVKVPKWFRKYAERFI